jgi:hypothetical protein
VAPPEVPTGLPSGLLRRRPDIRRADSSIATALARVGSAKADLFPKILLTGAAGRQSTDFPGFTLGAGNFFSIGPAITLPLFTGGRIRANIEVRKQQLEEALTSYRIAVLTALQESGSQLRDKFLAGITGVSEFLPAKVAVKPALVLSPVRQLVQGGGVIALLVLEGLERRKLDGVARGRIKGAVSAVVDGRGGVGHEAVGVLDALAQRQGVLQASSCTRMKGSPMKDVVYRRCCGLDVHKDKSRPV